MTDTDTSNLSFTENWKASSTRGLHFFHLNVNSVLSKIEELCQIAQRSNTAVIGITESKLDATVLDGGININAYEVIRSDRN